MGTLGGPNVWKISSDERSKHDEQFFTLKPINGFITGDQARGFFLQSGLPSAVLAQIWNLADLNKDGKMDRREFSIAMHLIQKKLQGFTIPPTLPETLKSDPDPTVGVFGVGFVSNNNAGAAMPGTWGHGQPPMMMAPMIPPAGMAPPPPPAAAAVPGIASPTAIPRTTSGKIDWSMNQGNKLKYSQHFNTIDKGKTGFLAGAHARNIFTQSGLPNPILAQIWNFADLDKDGRLTVEEFCIAMHLIDMVKLGATLPVALPMELVPAHLQHLHRQRTLSFGSDENAQAQTMVDDGEMGPRSAVSFEDKRRQNFEKGQAELERRRQLLQEQERREREERERKEREEFDRRERERLEQERRRQLELEKLQAKQREEQQKQEEEYRKMMEQREAARRELERQRQLEWERQRLIELTNQRQRDQESLCHAKQKQKNLSFQLQALNEKSADLNTQISEMREKIVVLTSSIESMKRDRDTKLVAIENGKRMAQELKTRSMQLGNEKLKLAGQRSIGGGGAGGAGSENPVMESYRQVMHTFHNREMNLETLRQSLADVEKELKIKQPSLDEKEKDFNQLSEKAKLEIGEYRDLINRLNEAVSKIRQSRGIQSDNDGTASNGGGGFFDDSAWGAAVSQASEAGGGGAWATDEAWKSANGHVTSSAAPGEAQGANTERYRALYEFNGTNEDELSFQPGDVIIIFKDHHGDEGWLAGQVGDKVGWFPQAFAEPMDSDVAWKNDQQQQQQQAPPQKLERIQEVPFEREDDARSSTRSSNVGQAGAEVKGQAGPVVDAGELVQAQFAWKAKTENHLSFNKGDQIRILEKQEMWWRGELNGATGWFPKSYVKPLDTSRRKSETPEPVKPPAFKRKSESQEFPSQASRSQEKSNLGGGDGEWYVAVYAFTASEPGDLGFEAGDRILVTQKNEDWWTGRVGDIEGVFPANYVQKGEPEPGPAPVPVMATVIEETPAPEPAVEVGEAIAEYQATDNNQLTLSVGDLVKIRAKSPTGWWEGEVQKKGESKRIGWFPGNYVQLLNSGTDKIKETVEAIFDYAKQQEDELAFNRGDKIVVVQKIDENWWKGETVDGRQGLFPANYVKPLDEAR